jgi:predicted AAA+ superfamily ATPase
MNIEPTLKYLLTRADPFICLIKGQWGVGKTYFVKKFIRDNREAYPRYDFAPMNNDEFGKTLVL